MIDSKNLISRLEKWSILIAANVTTVSRRAKLSSTCTSVVPKLSAALTATRTLGFGKKIYIFCIKNEINLYSKYFSIVEFKSHIKCITESEKYESKSSYVSKANKGEVKQNAWFEVI